MNTKTLSPRAMSVIDQYLHFKYCGAVCSVPYFNNKTRLARAGLRTNIGKGSPKDIFEEVQVMAIKNHIAGDLLADESLKKLLADENIGIDCSAFAYYVLNAESEELRRGPLEKHIHFVNCRGLVGKIRCSLRPVENCDVATLADDRNSTAIEVREAQPGDIITMMNDREGSERDHILIIHQVEYQNLMPTNIHYSHAVAYPEDSLYGSGTRQGKIEIADPKKPITEQLWNENDRRGADNRVFMRAKRSRTELRRLRGLA